VRGLVGVRAALVTSIGLVALAGWVAARDQSRSVEAQEWVRHTRDVLATAATTATAVDRAETAQRGFLLVGDSTYLPVGAHADRTAATALTTLRRLTTDNLRQQRRLDTLEDVLPRRLSGLARTVRMARAGDREGAVAIVRTGVGQAESNTIRALLDAFVRDEQRLLHDRMGLREERSRQARREMVVALLLAIGTAAWAVLVLGRAMGRETRARDALRAALGTAEATEARYRLLFTALPRPAWVYDRETLRFLAVNPAAAAQYGYTEAEFLAQRITDIRPEEDCPTVLTAIRAAGEAPLAARQWRHVWKDGTTRDVVVTTHALEYAGRSARLALVDDVTDRLRAERELRSREGRFRAAMTGMREAFFVLRAVERGGIVDDFEIVELNQGAMRLTGIPVQSAGDGASLRHHFPNTATSGILDVYRRVLETGKPYEGEHRAADARTRAEWIWLQVYPLDGEAGTLAVIVGDISSRKRAEVRLREEALCDPLTGLLNRRGLEDAVDRRLCEAAAAGRPDVLLYLDLDGFKAINDCCGHAEGDVALCAMADVLRRTVRAGDAIARLGGDEFVIYAPAGPEGAGARDVTLLVGRVQDALGVANGSAEASGRRYALRTSIGGAVVERGDTLGTLLARGDAALYTEKAGRRARSERLAS
jgi:diguanylate cyclase (GGDEF)-like protein/PAS domain S-box-containing protein